MCQETLQTIFRSVTIAKLLYASSAWSGFTKATDWQQVKGFLRCNVSCGYCSPDFPTLLHCSFLLYRLNLPHTATTFDLVRTVWNYIPQHLIWPSRLQFHYTNAFYWHLLNYYYYYCYYYFFKPSSFKTRVRKKIRNRKCWKDYCSGRSSNTMQHVCNKTELNRNSKTKMRWNKEEVSLSAELRESLRPERNWRASLFMGPRDLRQLVGSSMGLEKQSDTEQYYYYFYFYFCTLGSKDPEG